MSTNDVNANRNDNIFFAYADAIERPKKLTTEQLISQYGMNIPHSEAQEIIDALYQLSLITFKITQ